LEHCSPRSLAQWILTVGEVARARTSTSSFISSFGGISDVHVEMPRRHCEHRAWPSAARTPAEQPEPGLPKNALQAAAGGTDGTLMPFESRRGSLSSGDTDGFAAAGSAVFRAVQRRPGADCYAYDAHARLRAAALWPSPSPHSLAPPAANGL